jgi:hypothetical protein
MVTHCCTHTFRVVLTLCIVKLVKAWYYSTVAPIRFSMVLTLLKFSKYPI